MTLKAVENQLRGYGPAEGGVLLRYGMPGTADGVSVIRVGPLPEELARDVAGVAAELTWRRWLLA